jgi:lipoate-protein ligase A
MQYDVYLAQRLLEGSGNPTVRVYGWQPYAISLGYNQSVGDILVERCRIDGIDVVRRPTGGRAILHAHELTYSVVMEAGGRSIAQVYEDIGRAVVAALRYLGVEAEMSNNVLNFPALYGVRPSSVSCFTSISRSEIQCCGKKIVGSAQRRYGNVVLQHGSVLLGPHHRHLSEYIRWSDPREKERMDAVMTEKTIEVETVLGRRVTFEEAAEAMRYGFASVWNITLSDELDAKRIFALP